MSPNAFQDDAKMHTKIMQINPHRLFVQFVIILNAIVDDYHLQNFDAQGRDSPIPPGVYDLDGLKEYGEKRGWCPYFLARHSVSCTLTPELLNSTH